MEQISSINEFKKAIVCVMEAALSMHFNGFVHCDIRWPNIIFDWRYTHTYLLIDFEYIKRLDSNQISKKPSDGTRSKANDVEEEAIFDAASIIVLFSDSIHQEFEEFQELANYLYNEDDLEGIDKHRVEEKKDEIKRLFWKFYEENGKIIFNINQCVISFTFNNIYFR